MALILVVSPVPTHPPIAGNRVRIKNMLETLKGQGHVVHFLYCGDADVADRCAMVSAWDKCYFLTEGKKTGLKWLSKKVKALLNVETAWLDHMVWKINSSFIAKLFKPYKIDDWYNPNIDSKIRLLQEDYAFDTVLVEYVFLSRVFSLFNKDTIKILDTHDVYADRHLMFIKEGKIPHFFYTTEEQELIGLNRSDVLLAIQQDECDYFRRACDKKVVVVGHVCTPKKLKVNCIQESVNLLFIGNSAAPNLGALDFLCNAIYLQLSKRRIKFRCDIVGDITVPEKQLAWQFDFLGVVDNLEDYYKKADIILNPVKMGTGLNIKSIEAISYGKPLITTSIGAKGLSDGENTAFLVANEAAEFADKIEGFMNNRELYEEISMQAFLFSKKYNQNVISSLTNFL